MDEEFDIDEIEDRRICCECVGESYLSGEIRKVGEKSKCDYCGSKRVTIRISELADRIETAFEHHYVRTADEPSNFEYSLLADKELDYCWERAGTQTIYAIEEVAEIPEKAARDAQRILEERHFDFDMAAEGVETQFSEDAHYEERPADDRQWQEEWRGFQQSLKTEARFFDRNAERLLAEIFNGVETLRNRSGLPLVVDAGPGKKLTTLFRARSFQSDEKLVAALCRPDMKLGSPPSRLSKASRMNAAGISVFYGSSNPEVSLAEIRPPVGSRVGVACFEIIRPLKLLDLVAFGSIAIDGSVFDERFASHLERAVFLRSLSRKIAIPVMPNDETFDYLATQAIADYLATVHDPSLDGIIYPSVQADDKAFNVVLFNKSARVEPIDLPEGIEIEASLGHHTEDGWEVDYSVMEKVPISSEKGNKTEQRQFPVMFELEPNWTSVDTDYRPPTLRIKMDTVSVHEVESVRFKTTQSTVRRHRWHGKERKF